MFDPDRIDRISKLYLQEGFTDFTATWEQPDATWSVRLPEALPETPPMTTTFRGSNSTIECLDHAEAFFLQWQVDHPKVVIPPQPARPTRLR